MHTPGPWERYGDLIGRFIEGRHNWTHVATVYGDTDAEREANDRLIAAAPDMLKALQKILEKSPDREVALLAAAAIERATSGQLGRDAG